MDFTDIREDELVSSLGVDFEHGRRHMGPRPGFRPGFGPRHPHGPMGPGSPHSNYPGLMHQRHPDPYFSQPLGLHRGPNHGHMMRNPQMAPRGLGMHGPRQRMSGGPGSHVRSEMGRGGWKRPPLTQPGAKSSPVTEQKRRNSKGDGTRDKQDQPTDNVAIKIKTEGDHAKAKDDEHHDSDIDEDKLLKSDDEGEEKVPHEDLDAVSIHGDEDIDDMDKEVKGGHAGKSTGKIKKEPPKKDESESDDEKSKRERFPSERPKDDKMKRTDQGKSDFRNMDNRRPDNRYRKDFYGRGRSRGRGGFDMPRFGGPPNMRMEPQMGRGGMMHPGHPGHLGHPGMHGPMFDHPVPRMMHPPSDHHLHPGPAPFPAGPMPGPGGPMPGHPGHPGPGGPAMQMKPPQGKNIHINPHFKPGRGIPEGSPMGRPGPSMHPGPGGPGGPGPRMMHPHPNQGPEPTGPPMHGPNLGGSPGGPIRGISPRMEQPLRPMDQEPRPMHDMGPGPREPHGLHDGPLRPHGHGMHMDGPRAPQGPQFRDQSPVGPNMGPHHHIMPQAGPIRGPSQGGRPLSPPLQHPGMPGMHPQQNPGNMNLQMQHHHQQGMLPPIDHQASFNESERIVVGNRVIVPNVDQPSPMHGHMPGGFGGPPNAPPGPNMGAAAAAAAAVAAATRQQYFPFDYSSMYNAASWQQLLQHRDAYAAAYKIDGERKRSEPPHRIRKRRHRYTDEESLASDLSSGSRSYSHSPSRSYSKSPVRSWSRSRSPSLSPSSMRSSRSRSFSKSLSGSPPRYSRPIKPLRHERDERRERGRVFERPRGRQMRGHERERPREMRPRDTRPTRMERDRPRDNRNIPHDRDMRDRDRERDKLRDQRRERERERERERDKEGKPRERDRDRERNTRDGRDNSRDQDRSRRNHGDTKHSESGSSKRIVVGPSESKSKPSSSLDSKSSRVVVNKGSSGGKPTNRVVIGSLPDLITPSRLKELLAGIGPIQQLKMSTTKHKALVTFEKNEHALACRRKFHRTVVDDSQVTVDFL